MTIRPFISTTQRPLYSARAISGLVGALCAAAIALSGCAKPAGPIFEPLASPIAWPSPPDMPRIHYVGQLSTTADLKAGKSLGQALHSTLFGKPEVKGVVGPVAVEHDDRNRLFVADSGGRVVHVFDLDKRTYEQWSPPPPHGFITPVGLALARDGRLFVADSAAGLIWIFDAKGANIDAWGQDVLMRPCGMAFDDDAQQLLVADAGAHQVLILDAAGQPVARLGSRGSALGFFNFPVDVVIDHQRRLYVSDALNCRIQQFVRESQDASYVARLQIGSRGDMPGYFSRPRGVAVDSEDHLYVIDANFEAVQVYSSDGVLLMAFGREGRGPGEFWLPAGIHIDAADRLWIADTYNRRVQVFDYRAPPPTLNQPLESGEVSP